ncbi:hypothetical protein FNJ84_13475 [Paracoccus sp. M683]|uniref:hypothetical protein n=1 Tax=Paracoccus sp. M683 TaxID=2594268 RepID=UPI00117DCF4E|nr:hypothetical protein [Paracoccus sp. M683]TRW96288.1 hypothetical protein FNJ84_13475 [Paracoccus sp. M683]
MKLKPTTGLRYWRANDAVLLITGEAATVPPRHGEDGNLACRVQPVSAASIDLALDQLVAAIPACAMDGSASCNHCHEEPWNPLILEGEVAFYPARGISPTRTDAGLDTNALIGHWHLPSDCVDLAPGANGATRSVWADIEAEPQVHRAASILTPHAKLQLRGRIEAMIRQILEPRHAAAMTVAGTPPPEFGSDAEAFATLSVWFSRTFVDDPVAAELIATHYRLYQADDPAEYRVLSQAIGGFSEALAMRHQAPQLPIDDPLGFDSDQRFAARMRQAVGPETHTGVLPWNAFVPISAGAMSVRALRLPDSFGRFQDLDFDRSQVLAAGTMGENHRPHDGQVPLPPRLAQPARLCSVGWMTMTTRWSRPRAPILR